MAASVCVPKLFFRKYYVVFETQEVVHYESYNDWDWSQIMILFVCTAQKMKFSIKDFFSKCDQICSSLRIFSHLLKKSSMENFIFCAASTLENMHLLISIKSQTPTYLYL